MDKHCAKIQRPRYRCGEWRILDFMRQEIPLLEGEAPP